MAESAVKFLIQQLGPLLAEEVKLQKGVREEVLKIRDELESMRAFLKDADARENHSEGIKAWVRQVRNAAYDTEDILDEFIVHIQQYQHEEDDGGVCGFLCRMAQCIKQLVARHQIGKQIQDMRVRLSEISKRKKDYDLQKTQQVLSPNCDLEDGVYDARLTALFTEESQLVGIDGPKTWVIDWLLRRDQQKLSTISVVGMGGMGKTTLVKKVYDSQQVKEHFETYAWITVSETFKKMELLKEMIKQFYNHFYQANQEQVPSGLDIMTDLQLIQIVRDYLQNKRFVLVADDIWGVNAWKVLSLALPIHENGSRVILTMRRHDVASSCFIGPFDCIYQLQPLDSDNAWSLFCRRAFPTLATNENNFTLSSELEKLARSFVNKCRGLPLAIVTLGSLLATKDYVAWDLMHRSLGSELDIDNRLKSMMEILWLSFNDLPYYLKSCFSYLSTFPEDTDIQRVLIVRLWMAEGFIEKKEGKTKEEVAESYINALVSRSLIQVTSSEIDGEIISFRIHDLLREIIISKSEEENIIVFSSNIEGKITVSDRVRRLSIYHNKGKMVPKCESSSSSHLRSLFIFGEFGQSITSSAITSFVGLRLLRILNLTSIYMDRFPKDLTTLLHLRYLGLHQLEVKHLPSSIGELRNLESLIIEDTFICELPMEIYKLQCLRHLCVSRDLEESDSAFHTEDGVKVPSGIGKLTSLHNLRKLEAESGIVEELGKLTQLRNLEILKLKKEDGHHLCNSIEKMSHLKYLELNSIEEDEEMDLHSLIDPPLTLQELLLYGHLKELPYWISALKNLRILRLGWSGLKEDPLKVLSSLPNLVVLNIICNAYDGEELYAKEGGYPKLRRLELKVLRGLKKVTIEKEAMPNLEVLLIDECEVLVETPYWLEHLTNLKKLELSDMPVHFLNSLQSDDEEERANFIRHIPLVTHYDSESDTTQKF